MKGPDNSRSLKAMILSISFRLVSHFDVVELKIVERSNVEVEEGDDFHPAFQKRLVTFWSRLYLSVSECG